MPARFALLALVLLTACSQPASPPSAETASTEAPPPQATQQPPSNMPAPIDAATAAAMLSAQPAEGAWVFTDENGFASAGFGLPQSEFQFGVTCDRALKRIHLMVERELSSDQDTAITIVTAQDSVSFAARSFNEGLPTISAYAPGSDPRLGLLEQATNRFAIDIAGEAQVFPMHESVTRAIAACR